MPHTTKKKAKLWRF